MAFRSESQKKKLSLLGDAYYGVMVLPKELELEKEGAFELRFQAPDLRRGMNVRFSLFILFLDVDYFVVFFFFF